MLLDVRRVLEAIIIEVDLHLALLRVLVCGVHHVVHRAAVLGAVQAAVLILLANAQLADELQAKEQQTAQAAHPGRNGEDANDLSSKQAAGAAGVERAMVVLCAVVGLLDVIRLGQQAHKDAGPRTHPSVHGGCAEGVIDLELQEHPAHAIKDQTTHEASNESCPWLHHMRTSSDRHKAHQHTVAQRNQIPGLVAPPCVDQASQTTCCAGQGGSHSSTCSDLSTGGICNDQHGARVETIPSEPQQHSAEHSKHHRVTGHVHRVAHGVKAAQAGAHKPGAHHASEAASHVDDS
mmetsp:Transcript_8516/g.22797  ORF Transcript_8516/g.22797 Transcript_8516/m.22797 type:complete len:292 (-) Transcript_8516:828-1703(-)